MDPRVKTTSIEEKECSVGENQSPNHRRSRESPKRLDVDELEERRHFYHIVNTFRSYKINAFNRLSKTHKYLDSLPERHQKCLENYRKHLQNISKAIEKNYEIIGLIIEDISNLFENIDYTSEELEDPELKHMKGPTSLDSDKVNAVLKQLVREWTDEGSNERKTCFDPILNQLEEYFKDCADRSAVHVLVPGAGLGRLPLEIARRGFTCQGNEYSLFMLFTSNFILNKCKEKYIFEFHPWAQQYTNNVRSEDQLSAVRFPDINPGELPPTSDFSMAAGNFIEIYKEPNSWQCITTSYFIDTANNVVDYIETIWNILTPGGVWINLGPLLYHYADLNSEQSIEPSYEIIKEVILSFGFEFIKEETNVSSYYTQNPHSMLAYEYRSVFFVCKKPL